MDNNNLTTFTDIITTREFEKWLSGLRDDSSRQRITLKIEQIKYTKMITGDWKRIEGGQALYEFRYTFGEGYRIYFSRERDKILLIVAGSSKKNQRRTIRKAISILESWRRKR
ncbi:MAG: hypothetical protein LKI93_04095 [Bifidobacteriaceae bacterium]|jgi:putative addiction module killer protein|nr:hypothetical protein [Bifidobacteriaceae bacterium]MCI1914836.1 hypothetical protein [Bifidobacteriaceae bacterium]